MSFTRSQHGNMNEKLITIFDVSGVSNQVFHQPMKFFFTEEKKSGHWVIEKEIQNHFK